MTSPAQVPQFDYASAATRFIQQIRSLSATLPALMDVIHDIYAQSCAAHEVFLKNHATQLEKPGSYDIPREKLAQFRTLARERDDMLASAIALPRSLIISMVSEFDVLLGRLLTAAIADQPSMLNASGRMFTYSQVVEFGDVASLRSHMIEKEVESVLRMSHTEQFSWLEGKLGVPLTKGLNSWPLFVELTERRNLLVHADGVVSSHYLAKCQEYGAPLPPDIKVGTKLRVDRKYCRQCRDVLIEVGVKLSQVMWRHIRSKEVETAETGLVDATYDLLSMNMNRAAEPILEFFVVHLKRWACEEKRTMCVINYAQALKWTKQREKMEAVLGGLHEKVLSGEYRLGIAVLRDEFEKAAEIMKSLGSSGPITMENYRDWPLFKEFRKADEFLGAFQSIFGRKFDEYYSETEKLYEEVREEAKQMLQEQRRAKENPESVHVPKTDGA